MSRLALGATALLAVVAVGASAAERARIVDARSGTHDDYDRVVIELDREAEARQLPVEAGGVRLEIDADLQEPIVALGSARMGILELRPAASGTLVRAPARERSIRVFRLGEPPRIVIDLGAPGAVLEPPAGAAAIPAAAPPAPDPVGVRPRLAPEPVPPSGAAPEATAPRQALAPTEPAPSPAGASALEPEPAPSPAGASALEPEPAPSPAGATPLEPEPATPAPMPPPEPPRTIATGPEPGAPAAAPEPAGAPAPRPTEPPARARGSESGGYLSVLVWGLVGAVLACAGGWALWRGRAAREGEEIRDESETDSVGSRVTSGTELAHSLDRLDVLEKRLDEEVRARLLVEERLVQTREDLKVLRDRLHRSSRREERPG